MRGAAILCPARPLGATRGVRRSACSQLLGRAGFAMWFGTVFGGSRCQRVQCLRFSFSLARQARCDFARPDVISRPEMMSVSDASVGRRGPGSFLWPIL